jgi:hypothetical protein
MVKSYRDLDVWKRANAAVLHVYRVSNLFPRSEQFGLVSQLRRAAYSIPANIAEGSGRRSTASRSTSPGLRNTGHLTRTSKTSSEGLR